jgi:hypothetical protein
MWIAPELLEMYVESAIKLKIVITTVQYLTELSL